MGVLQGLFKRNQSGQQQAQPPGGGFGGSAPQFNEEYAAMVNKEYSRRQTEKMPFTLQWRLNMEFINGNQYLDINPSTHTLEEIPRLSAMQEREVFNQLATILETRISKLTRQRPMFKTRPASSDDGDVSASKISTMLLGSTWNDQDMNIAYGDATAWMEHTGTVFFKPIWSTQKGRIIYQGVMPTNQPQQQVQDPAMPNADPTAIPDDGQNVFMQNDQLTTIREGDVDTAIVPPHEIFPDSSYRNDVKNCRSIIHARAYHVDEIEENWGMRVDPEDVDVMTLQKASASGGGMGYMGTSFRTGVSKMESHAVVKEYYERPSKKYPQGRFIVVAGNKTLFAGPMPYMLGEDGGVDIPLIRVVSIDSPGTFWGKSIIERCIPIQRRYNAFRNRKAEYMNLVAIGQWYEPDGSIDEGVELNNLPGNIIRYRATINGVKPEPVMFPNLPNSFEIEGAALLAEFTSISGVSELSRYSEAPSGVKSGIALSQASEQDDTRIATTSANMAESMVLLGKFWLRLYRQFVQEPRILRSVGSNRDVEVRQWVASDLKSDDVILENAAALAETPSQRRQMVFDLLTAGLFNKPEVSNLSEDARQRVFEMLEYGHWESEAEDMLWLQRNRARRENDQMMQGMMVPAMDFDDDMLHIDTHNKQRMQVEYEQLLQTPIGQAVDSAMRTHIAQHQLKIQANMQAQLEQQTQQAQAQKGESGSSPPPASKK